MQYARLGETGLIVSRLALGSMTFGAGAGRRSGRDMGRRSLVAKRVVLVAKKTWTAFEPTATILPTPSDV